MFLVLWMFCLHKENHWQPELEVSGTMGQMEKLVVQSVASRTLYGKFNAKKMVEKVNFAEKTAALRGFLNKKVWRVLGRLMRGGGLLSGSDLQDHPQTKNPEDLRSCSRMRPELRSWNGGPQVWRKWEIQAIMVWREFCHLLVEFYQIQYHHIRDSLFLFHFLSVFFCKDHQIIVRCSCLIINKLISLMMQQLRDSRQLTCWCPTISLQDNGDIPMKPPVRWT